MKCKLIIIILGLFVAVCFLLGGYLLGKHQMFKTLDYYEMENLASRLGVENNWEAIRHYVYCNLLRKGKRPDQIMEDLRTIGQFLWDDRSYKIFGDHITIVFENHHIKNNIGSLVLYFDENGQLAEVYKMIGIGDMVRLDDKCKK